MRKITLTSEERLQLCVKMDAVNLQGVWTNFPQQAAAATGRMQYAAGLLEELMRRREEEERRAGKRRRPLPKKKRLLLIDEVIARIETEDRDDLFSVLAL